MKFKTSVIIFLVGLVGVLSSPASFGNGCSFEVPQAGRSEPQYKGLSGFLIFKNNDGTYDPYKKLPKYPWKVTSLKQVGPKKWQRKGKKFDSKTPVTVIEQNLNHSGYGIYSGNLTVRINKTGEEIKIRKSNFTPVKYWECSLKQAVKHSFYIAKIVNPDAKAISKKGLWEEIGKEKRVFCSKSGDRASDPNVSCFLYKKYKYRYGGIPFQFNPKDLEIVY